MPLILGAQSAVATGYSIENSCRFNDVGYLIRTPSSSGDPKTFTISCWLKRSNFGAVTADQTICTSEKGSGYRYTYPFYLNGADDCMYAFGGTFDGGGPVILDKKTVAVYRDSSAWFHYYFVYDTTESAAADRIQLYINGTRITDAGAGGGYSPNTIPGLNEDSFFGNTTDPMSVAGGSGGGSPFDGYMAEFIFVDGSVPAVTEFGEFDEDSPTIWKPKDPSEATITWGTNGLWLDFKDSADLGNDVSGQGNDMTANSLAAVDQCTDSPTNNFCTLNTVTKSSYTDLSEGNTTAFGNNAGDNGNIASTLCPDAGKWYAECKFRTLVSGYPNAGVYQIKNANFGKCENGGNAMPGYYADECNFASNGNLTVNNSTTGSWGSTPSAGDIIQVAVDCDNGAVYIGINDTWQNSGDPESGGTRTGAAVTWTPGASFVGTSFGGANYNGSYADWNFGNPSFTLTSAVADGNGYGSFEYAPPSGYLALCTKNLGSSGG